MSESPEIRKTADGLAIRSTMRHSSLHALFSALVSALFFGFVAHFYFSASTWSVACVSLFGAAIGYFEVMRYKTAELHAARLEFQTTSGGWYGKKYSVPRASIRWLEYRDESGGPDAYAAGGLYAVMKHGSKCILPNLDRQQTDAVIEAIRNEFPDMLVEPTDQGNSLFGGHFARLRL